MIATGVLFRPTQISGLLSYGLSLSAWIIASMRINGNFVRSRLAAAMGLVEGFLFLDVLFNWRWMLNWWLISEAKRENLYDSRRGPQIAALLLLIGMALMGVRWAFRRYRGRFGALLALSGVLLSLALWCSEVVSLHQLDVLLYRPVGPLMVVSLLWISISLVTSIGILIDGAAPPGPARAGKSPPI